MSRIPTPATIDDAPAASRPLLEAVKKQLGVAPNLFRLVANNPAALEHNVTIAQGSRVLGATPSFISGTRKVTVKLAPGTYTFYCSVPGHRAAGMEGTLTVS